MKLTRISEKVWISEYEDERDRPALGYVRGRNWSLAVDAGHSQAHLREFYDALTQEGLPLPSLTVITHWHWDHSFAMHCLHGLSLAGEKTNEHLKDFIAKRSPEYDRDFLSWDPSIGKEYRDQEITVVPADIVYHDALQLDAGDTRIEIFEAVSPHTDDATRVFLPEEKILFLGDSISGVFPTWVADPEKTAALIETIEKSGAELCIGGHWDPWETEDLLKELRER